jgi:ribosomal protein L12E/L44/L45/RPP1/RPP2
MNDSELKLGNRADSKSEADWDEETITEQILAELNGAVTRSTIQEVLREVAPNYKDVRVQSFVPIFIRRDVVERLRAMQTTIASQGINEATESQAIPNPASSSNAEDEQDKTIGTELIGLKPAT